MHTQKKYRATMSAKIGARDRTFYRDTLEECKKHAEEENCVLWWVVDTDKSEFVYVHSLIKLMEQVGK